MVVLQLPTLFISLVLLPLQIQPPLSLSPAAFTGFKPRLGKIPQATQCNQENLGKKTRHNYKLVSFTLLFPL